MAIKREFYRTRNDGINLCRTYSDNGKVIQKVGTDEFYDEAIDIEGNYFEYVETDKLVGDNVEEDYPDIYE